MKTLLLMFPVPGLSPSFCNLMTESVASYVVASCFVCQTYPNGLVDQSLPVGFVCLQIHAISLT